MEIESEMLPSTSAPQLTNRQVDESNSQVAPFENEINPDQRENSTRVQNCEFEDVCQEMNDTDQDFKLTCTRIENRIIDFCRLASIGALFLNMIIYFSSCRCWFYLFVMYLPFQFFCLGLSALLVLLLPRMSLIIQSLNFIPSFGSSLWTLTSVGACYFLISLLPTSIDPDAASFTILLYTFINFPIFIFILATESKKEGAHSLFFTNGTFHYGIVKILNRKSHDIEIARSEQNFSIRSETHIQTFSVSHELFNSYERIEDGAENYLQGLQYEVYKKEFEIWKI